MRHIVSGDGRAQEIEANQVIKEISPIVGRDGFRDLERRELDRALSDHTAGERGRYKAARLRAVEKRLDLPVPLHPVRQTGPACALSWSEYRSHQRENAGRLAKHPRRVFGEMFPV